MPLTPATLSDLTSHGFDTVIDVRSPSEFAEDHVPGAINLPVLSDEERAEVGTIYVQDSPFKGRKVGAAKVFRNISTHVAGPLAAMEGGWKPLVYCWRGGQRSGAFAWALKEIGWRADTLVGGYQSYRRLVFRALYETPLSQPVVLLDGYTGTAKTDLLHLLKDRGVQVIDLEGLAGHRGSLLGALDHPQPAQKRFESGLAAALDTLDPSRPVLIEAESNKIGERIVPPSLWTAMKAAPRIQVRAPVEDRVAYLVQAYDDILSDSERLTQKLTPLRAHRGGEVVDRWMDLIASGDKPALTRSLMLDHYDPAYDKSRRSIGAETLAEVEASSLTSDGLTRAAAYIERALDAFTPG
ncbi:MAG: tRNA 2-selenouridine(34) synthase MnmH [Paracoccaceae bacterium]